MRVLIFGGRDFIPTWDSWWWLENVVIKLFEQEDVTIVSGMATGADSFGISMAAYYAAELDQFPADWKTHGKTAGHIRNQQMLDSGIDVAIQFPGGRGTADMRRRLDEAGVRVIEYKEEELIGREE